MAMEISRVPEKYKNFTINFGPQHPAAQPLRLLPGRLRNFAEIFIELLMHVRLGGYPHGDSSDLDRRERK